MTSTCIIRNLLLAATLAWGLSSAVGRASVDDGDLSQKVAELQGRSQIDGVVSLQHNDEEAEAARTEPFLHEVTNWWLEAILAVLSPDQRGQLRSQIRDHWQRMSAEQRQQLRDEHRAEDSADSSYEATGRSEENRTQRLSPDQRSEFRQWMRDRREYGPDGNGGRGDPR